MKTRSIFSLDAEDFKIVKMIWIGSDSLILAKSDSNSGKIEMYDLSKGFMSLVSSKDVGIVSSMCPIGYPNHPALVCIGYIDGNIEYRSVPDLNIVTDDGCGLYLVPDVETDADMMTDLDDFFQNTQNLRLSSMKPLQLIPSVNGLFPITLAKSKYEEKIGLVINLPKFRFDKMEEKMLDQLSQLIATLTTTSLLNGFDTGDIKLVCSAIPDSIGTLVLNRTHTNYQYLSKSIGHL